MSQQVINETPDRRKHAARRRVHQREDISRARPLRQHTRSTLVSRERPLLVLGVRRYGCDVSAPEVSCANRSRRAWASAESAASEFQDSSSSIACAGVIPLATRLTTCATEMRRPRIVARPGNNSSLCASARTSSPCTSSMIVRRRLTEWFKFRLEWRRRDPCPLPRGTLSRAFSDRNEAAVVGESSGPAARRSRRLQHVSTNQVDLRALEDESGLTKLDSSGSTSTGCDHNSRTVKESKTCRKIANFVFDSRRLQTPLALRASFVYGHASGVALSREHTCHAESVAP